MLYYIIIAAILLIFAVIWLNNNILVYGKYKVDCAEKNGFLAVQLSDLHSKSFGNRIYNRMKKIKPDVIFVTGDLVDDTRSEAKVIRLMARLAKEFKIYYICGNHDHRIDRLEDNLELLRKSGVRVLTNEIEETEINGESVAILGLDENQASKESYKQRKLGTFKYKDNGKYLHRLETYSGIRIVLSHYPENFALIGDVSYNQYSFDVMLSGHAHGGQWRFPFVGGLFAPGQGAFPKYCAGEHGTRPKLIISRGLGNSNFPFRFLNFPEINIISFVKK